MGLTSDHGIGRGRLRLITPSTDSTPCPAISSLRDVAPCILLHSRQRMSGHYSADIPLCVTSSRSRSFKWGDACNDPVASVPRHWVGFHAMRMEAFSLRTKVGDNARGGGGRRLQSRRGATADLRVPRDARSGIPCVIGNVSKLRLKQTRSDKKKTIYFSPTDTYTKCCSSSAKERHTR